MTVFYGLRTRDGSGLVTFDTSITTVRSLKMMQVKGNGSFDQFFSIPEIKAESFVVVDTLENAGEYTYSPQAWFSTGQLQLRRPGSKTWQVMILSQGGEPFSGGVSYGMHSFNNNSKSQIDSNNRLLSIRYSGSYSLGVGSIDPNIEGDDFRSFPSPITTYERPLIFLNSSDYLMVGQLVIFGSPGNWTGFKVNNRAHPIHGPQWSQPQRIMWYCASYLPPASPVGQYGLSVSDESSVKTFVTTANLALLNSQPATNEFVTRGDSITGVGGYYASSQQMPWTGSYSDYVLANALLSSVNIAATSQPYRANFGGFLPGNRSILQMYCENESGINPVTPNGRTLFASRPMKQI